MNSSADRERALALVPVSRETEDRLDIYVSLLAKWLSVTNLISPASFAEVWTRHIADSAQLQALAPDARTWVDMGAGAGFPGMVLAIQLADRPEAKVHLIESDQRKCAFLREVARATGAAAQIHNERIEIAAPKIPMPVDAVTARALAPLPRLLDFATLWLDQGAIGVFPRGRTADAQSSDFPKTPAFAFDFVKSRIDPTAQIVVARRARSSATSGDA